MCRLISSLKLFMSEIDHTSPTFFQLKKCEHTHTHTHREKDGRYINNREEYGFNP